MRCLFGVGGGLMSKADSFADVKTSGVGFDDFDEEPIENSNFACMRN